jgi:glutaredoxin
MKCPKCSYVRRFGETAPDWQCPSCGVAYAKAGAPAAERARPASGGGGQLLLAILAVAVVAIGGVAWKAMRPAAQPATVLAADGQPSVIMYSLTTCGFCNQKRAQLRAEGIPFVEYFLDQDQERLRELIGKLEAAGMKPGGIGTPSFDVNGKILLNNPSLETIRQHL